MSLVRLIQISIPCCRCMSRYLGVSSCLPVWLHLSKYLCIYLSIEVGVFCHVELGLSGKIKMIFGRYISARGSAVGILLYRGRLVRYRSR